MRWCRNESFWCPRHIVTRVIENVHAHGPLNLLLYIVNILGRYGHSLGVELLLKIQHSFVLHSLIYYTALLLTRWGRLVIFL